MRPESDSKNILLPHLISECCHPEWHKQHASAGNREKPEMRQSSRLPSGQMISPEQSAVIRPCGPFHASNASYIFNNLIGLLSVGILQTEHPGQWESGSYPGERKEKDDHIYRTVKSQIKGIFPLSQQVSESFDYFGQQQQHVCNVM